MAKITFSQGESLQRMDYTPETDIDAGEPVVLGDLVGITHRPIPANEVGSLALGGGIYYADAIDDTIEIGENVYWDNRSDGEGISNLAGDFIGKAVSAGDTGDRIYFLHVQSSPAATASS